MSKCSMLRFGGKKKTKTWPFLREHLGSVLESFSTLVTTWYLSSSSAATSRLRKRTSKYPAAVEQIATEEMWQRILLRCRRVTARPHISLAGLAAGIVPVTSRVTQPTDFLN